MLLQGDRLNFLIEVGFTKTQAKLYLALIEIGKTDIKNLSKQVDVPRQEIYRALGELQEKGFVEKIIAIPLEFQAVSFQHLTSIIVNRKANEYKKILEKTEHFLKKCGESKQEQHVKQEYRISMIEGKKTIINRIKAAHESSQQSVCCFSTFHRWIQIGYEIHETVQKAVARGVIYRIVVEKPAGEASLPREVESLMKNSNFQVKMICRPLKANAVIFDGKLTGFNFYPSKSINESPMIWTNHPSIIASFQEKFKNIWNTESKKLIFSLKQDVHLEETEENGLDLR